MSHKNNSSSKTTEEHFPIKLHRILKDAEELGFSDSITWMPDGASFTVLDKIKLEKEIMPRYFVSCQFKSLQRTLNMWGFAASQKLDAETKCSRRFHPLFIKGRPELCLGMRRVRVKQPGSRMKNSFSRNKNRSNEDKKPVVNQTHTFADVRTFQENANSARESALGSIAELLHGNHPGRQSIQGIGDVSSLIQFPQSQPNVLLSGLLSHSPFSMSQQQALPPRLLSAALVNMLSSNYSIPEIKIKEDNNTISSTIQHEHANKLSADLPALLASSQGSLAASMLQQQRHREELLLLGALCRARSNIHTGRDSHSNKTLDQAVKVLLADTNKNSTTNTMNSDSRSSPTTSGVMHFATQQHVSRNTVSPTSSSPAPTSPPTPHQATSSASALHQQLDLAASTLLLQKLQRERLGGTAPFFPIIGTSSSVQGSRFRHCN